MDSIYSQLKEASSCIKIALTSVKEQSRQQDGCIGIPFSANMNIKKAISLLNELVGYYTYNDD